MSVDVGRVERAIAQAEEAALEMVRLGRIEDALRCVFGTLREALVPLVESVRELRESLEMEVRLRKGELGALRGEVVELRVIQGLRDWFKEHAPAYRLYGWPMRRGPDLIIEGRGLLVAVEAAVRPKKEDVDQLISGAGIVKLEWGRKPDLLVIYSYSGVVPDDVARYAAERSVKIVKGPRELRELLDEVAEGRQEG